MTRVFALTVGRNEVERYLVMMLVQCKGVFDGHLFFDDQSTDQTPEVAEALGCTVRQRSSSEPAFLEHEGQFRQAAWRAFEEELQPQDGDWVLSVDCDEFLVGRGDRAKLLRLAVQRAKGHVGILMPIPEVFALEGDSPPLVRTDGFWGSIAGPRLFRYRPNGVFASKGMGSGSEPTYVAQGKLYREPHGLHLMHYGYARPEDRRAKFHRYNGLAHGHADSHVRSILERPRLQRWDGPMPEMEIR